MESTKTKAVKKFGLIIAASVMSLSLTGCGKDRYGMVKVKGGALSQPLIDSLSLRIDNPSPDATPESPVFSLEVSDFYISKYEVTQELYKEIMSVDSEVNATPSYFNESPFEGEEQTKRPVERITWYDALDFCNKLSIKEGLDPVYTIRDISRYSKDNAIKYAAVTADYSRNGYRLPTAAEWIYAATGGAKSKENYKYSGSDNLDDIAWHDENSSDMTHQVGLKKANELGLYDMTGNVAEWCWDYTWNEKFEYRPYNNYKGPKNGITRIIKGGSFDYLAVGTFFAYENNNEVNGIQGLRYFNVGFRIARNAD